jgi:hypothetical protein
MAAVLRSKPHDVRQRLAELGLTVEILHDVVRAAQLARASCTPNDPPLLPGFLGYAYAIRKLRELLLPLGWRKDDPGNFSRTINDQRRIYVVVASGNEFAGRLSEAYPATKNPKGRHTEEAVKANRQIDLFPWTIPEEAKQTAETAYYQAWWLLSQTDDEAVFLELSRPHEMNGGQIIDWAERIILPPLEGPSPATVPDDFGPDFDPPVGRI